MNWIQQLFYRWSGHKCEETKERKWALWNMYQQGIEVGKKQAQPIIIEKRVCRLHPMVLLHEIELGHYVCSQCQVRPLRPLNIYNDVLRTGAGPQTAVQQAVGQHRTRYVTRKLYPIKG